MDDVQVPEGGDVSSTAPTAYARPGWISMPPPQLN